MMARSSSAVIILSLRGRLPADDVILNALSFAREVLRFGDHASIGAALAVSGQAESQRFLEN